MRIEESRIDGFTQLPVAIRHLQFAIRHLQFAICHLLFARYNAVHVNAFSRTQTTVVLELPSFRLAAHVPVFGRRQHQLSLQLEMPHVRRVAQTQ
jgi:hypothetical protein